MAILVAILWTGEVCEALLMKGEQINNAKAAVVANYGLTITEIKEWRIQSC